MIVLFLDGHRASGIELHNSNIACKNVVWVTFYLACSIKEIKTYLP